MAEISAAIDEIERLMGDTAQRRGRWSEMHRHMYFGQGHGCPVLGGWLGESGAPAGAAAARNLSTCMTDVPHISHGIFR
jgi:hypothetical protein